MKSSPLLQKTIEQIKNSSGLEKKRLFIDYCDHLISLKEGGGIREEEVGYEIVSILFMGNDLQDIQVIDDIFSYASDLEIPRETSYRQPIGNWDERAANSIKKDEWNLFVMVVQEAKKILNAKS